MLYLAQQPRVESQDAQRALQAADGYLFLGMHHEAMAELNTVPIVAQGDPAVLLARVRVLLHRQNWSDADELTARCIEAFPEIEEFTVQRAFAICRIKTAEVAIEVIEAAPAWIRRTGILHYNLACYEARLGDLSMARRCIDTAIQINSAMARNAKVDPDLQGLYN
ncbi:MAG: hypothetical protein ABIZ56_05710 [Chthoniobacteraceae bacterium]